MPAQGGFTPGFERYGGAVPTLQRILESLNQQRGTAYDTTPTSSVWVENMAFARAINDVWDTNGRLANQNDPPRLTATLPRWETILGLPADPSLTPVDRRARVLQKRARVGQAVTMQVISDALSTALGPVFVTLVHLDPTDAVTWWPGGTPNPDAPWYSTIAHILIKTVLPSGWTEAQYQAAIAKIFPIMDDIAPSWATWDHYRNGVHAGGPWSKDPNAGFFLDDPHNLGNEVFDR